MFRTIMGSERDWKRIGRGGIEEGKVRERLSLKWEEGVVKEQGHQMGGLVLFCSVESFVWKSDEYGIG